LKWSQPKGYLFEPGEKTPLDLMVEEAATKHQNLMASRGVPEKLTDRLRFSLRELVETLEKFPGKVGLLLYSLDNAGLKILYADNTRKTDTVIIHVDKSRLNLLNGQLQSMLNPGSTRGLQGTSKTRPGAVDSLSRIISQLLLPAKFDLSGLDHLVVIPTFNIGTFPFAMLPLKDSMMLIDKMSYSIVPSINEFIITGQLSKSTSNNRGNNEESARWNLESRFLFVGSPAANVIGQYKFDALPGTKSEIESIGKLVPEKQVLIDKDAVKSKVIKAMKEAEVIYFATHGIADAEDPLNKSFILLTGKNDSAILTAKEIQKLDLKAAMVILSACETGLGKSHEGGTIGLSRAFEIAGAKNVLMSLWPVSDSKTPVLMKYFFESLDEKEETFYFPHEALRQAILKFKKQDMDPRYWAAFSLFGVPY
jgi:CHAT domain-containing protein